MWVRKDKHACIHTYMHAYIHAYTHTLTHTLFVKQFQKTRCVLTASLRTASCDCVPSLKGVASIKNQDIFFLHCVCFYRDDSVSQELFFSCALIQQYFASLFYNWVADQACHKELMVGGCGIFVILQQPDVEFVDYRCEISFVCDVKMLFLWGISHFVPWVITVHYALEIS